MVTEATVTEAMVTEAMVTEACSRPASATPSATASASATDPGGLTESPVGHPCCGGGERPPEVVARVTTLPKGAPRAKRLLLALADTSLADASLAQTMVEGLRRAGHEIVWRVSTAQEALEMTRAVHPELLILDEALEGGGGLEVCRRLRSELVRTPVILLTADNTAEHRVRGLRTGADDCLSRTSALEEVALRVSVVLRRSRPQPADLLFRCGSVTLDARAHRVSRDGRWVHLKPIEFQLLHCFLRHQDIDLDRVTLIEKLWGHRSSGDNGVLTLTVSSLRKKVDMGQPKLIRTVRGVGYRMSEPGAGSQVRTTRAAETPGSAGRSGQAGPLAPGDELGGHLA